MKKQSLIVILGGILFLAVLIVGFRAASLKPVWNDEIYSQVASVESLSYGQIFFGQVNEGNNTPLFYLLQKLTCDVMGYQTPLEWRVLAKVWDFDRHEDRIVLRIVPVICISLAAWLIFSYFARFYALPTALLSVILSVSTAMFLQYGIEARPYALWILLTTIQVLIFLRMTEVKEKQKSFLRSLTIIHFLLAFTSILSIVQIVFVSVLLWVYGLKERKNYVFLSMMPILTALTFVLISPKYPFGLMFTVDQYLRANISRDRFYLFWFFVSVLGVYGVQSRLKKKWITWEILSAVPALALFCSAVLGACLLLLVFKFRQGPVVQFPVTEKYLIFLAPVGVICTTLFADAIVRGARSNWLKIVFVGAIAGFLIPRLFKVVGIFLKQYPQLFS